VLLPLPLPPVFLVLLPPLSPLRALPLSRLLVFLVLLPPLLVLPPFLVLPLPSKSLGSLKPKLTRMTQAFRLLQWTQPHSPLVSRIPLRPEDSQFLPISP